MGLFSSWERIDTENGILAVANFVRDSARWTRAMSLKKMNTEVAGYDVYLPAGGCDPWAVGYATFLFHHPHSKVRLHYRVYEDANGIEQLEVK